MIVTSGGETDDLLRLLAWYREMGVDALTSEVPIDWRQRPDAGPGSDFVWPQRSARLVLSPVAVAPTGGTGTGAAPSPPRVHPPDPASKPNRPLPAGLGTPAKAATPAARTFPTTAPDDALLSARRLARQAQTLDDLRRLLAAFDGCGLKATAKTLCFSRGADRADLMVIGEAPGREEDAEGRPFVGREGLLLDLMLAAIGRSDADTHITNMVYWRPPGNRTPTPQETLVCRPFLERQIELVAPQRVLLLGGAVAKLLLDTTDNINKLRGTWRPLTIGNLTVPSMATMHPSYLLRTPAAKRQAWADLLAVKAAFAGG